MQEDGKISDHLANERTFPAWIRTSVGLMGFGFVVASHCCLHNTGRCIFGDLPGAKYLESKWNMKCMKPDGMEYTPYKIILIYNTLSGWHFFSQTIQHNKTTCLKIIL